MIGLSDAGAHVNLLCDAGYCTYLLGTWVRERNAITLEYAVKRITSEPADFFGLKGRGRLAAGAAADIAMFDADTVGSPRRGTMLNDLPGGGKRLVMPATDWSTRWSTARWFTRTATTPAPRPGAVIRW